MAFDVITARFGQKGLTAAGLVALCVVVGILGFFFVQTATSRLLDAEARIDASRWSSYLSANVRQLKKIAGGATATRDDRAALDRTLAGGYLLSYRIYDSHGILKLQSSPELGIGPIGQKLATLDSGFAKAFIAGTPATSLKKGTYKGQPVYYASALVPIKLDTATIGWLVLTIDQTERAQLFFAMATQASIAVCLLLIAAPIFGFWYRARNRAMMEQTLDDMSKRDQLTGFMVKPTLLDALDSKLGGARPGDPQLALIFCEMTGAPGIAHIHGQQAEEQVIRQAAARLPGLLPDNTMLASAGRGSFLVLVDKVTDPMLVLNLARDITQGLTTHIELDGMKLSCSCHSGIALSSTDGDTASLLMRNAELALLTAREQGTPGYGFYNPELAQDSRRRLNVQRAVAAAHEQKSFRLDFQPVYNIRTGVLNGFEALIRLEDSELGAISPTEFIPIAEQAGLINEIGGWALDEACRVAAQWPQHLMVAVNLSPSQFMSGTLIQDVRRALQNHSLPGYRLEVEITEGTLMNDSELVLGQLRVLRDMGVAVALDDFGTGYSSLGYLWKFPFSKLKIDRSFVNALDASTSAKGILRSIVKLGHGLGLTVTAEGIENTRQLSTLRELGCDLAQGYLLDRPARVPDLAAIILRNFANGLTRRQRYSVSSKSAA
ncbi:putative bifunctional diguanylate cyclase/phosphodiesterase [Aestuariivirga sp.]|uniref:putative bifunctional diguanylate cyclase/phosphodiesterase n=1 Tax=Aestuariivirga sp. TaxID=2650926 RepID=UPI003593F5AD